MSKDAQTSLAAPRRPLLQSEATVPAIGVREERADTHFQTVTLPDASTEAATCNLKVTLRRQGSGHYTSMTSVRRRQHQQVHWSMWCLTRQAEHAMACRNSVAELHWPATGGSPVMKETSLNKNDCFSSGVTSFATVLPPSFVKSLEIPASACANVT